MKGLGDIKYSRILFKISGEALSGSKGFGLNMQAVEGIVSNVCDMINAGLKVCLVVGGGNMLRGASMAQAGIERTTADYMGMMATVINALALQSMVEKCNVPCEVFSAIPMRTVCQQYVRRKALKNIDLGSVVIFAAGTGNPFFSTDTAAVLRAIEMNCDVIIKGTQVDGVYSDDPRTNASAKRYEKITYNSVIADNLSVMDGAAIALARDNSMPIIIFSLDSPGELLKIVRGHGRYTIINN